MAEDKKQITKTVKTPIQHGLKDIDDIFKDNEKYLKSITFISTAFIEYDINVYNLPNQNRFLHVAWNKIYLVTKLKKKLKIDLKANFVPTEVKECLLEYNDKSGKKSSKYYLATLKNANCKIEKDIEISNNSKSDYKQFQTSINEFYNDFAVNMTESEFKTFVAEYISPKVASKATIYTNAGLINDNALLYKNALATKDGYIWADENGYIKIDENSHIKINESTHSLPKLFKSNKTGQQIANELLTNIIECWNDNIVLPMMALGSMVMSIYYNDFIKGYGAPTLILYGETGTGKSTLVVTGLAIFGLTKEALTSGSSTTKSNEYFCSRYNCLNVCIDDVKAETLTSSNFTAFIKGVYKGIPRTRMLPYGKGVEYIQTCSPLAYSTNETLPDLKEVINRLNVIEIFGNVFKANKFKYHELDKDNKNNLAELSLILPEFLKYPKENVFKCYEDVFKMLEDNVQDTQRRIINNLSYAYTGALMLLSIAGIEIDGLQDKVIEYAKKQVEKYENLKSVVDKVLSEIVVLYDLKQIEKDINFKICTVNINDKEERQVRFKKDVIISAINKFYGNDKQKRINEQSFISYAKNHKRFRGSITSRIDGKPSNAMCFDVTDLEEYNDFFDNIEPMSYQDLQNGIKGNHL